MLAQIESNCNSFIAGMFKFRSAKIERITRFKVLVSVGIFTNRFVLERVFFFDNIYSVKTVLFA